MSVEPRMEDLLASIRNAIHDDADEPRSLSGQSSGTLYKGAMRELHVRVGEEANSAADEIQQLRNRINQTRIADLSREAPPSLARPAGLRPTLTEEVEARRTFGRPAYLAPETRQIEDWRSKPAEEVPPPPAPSWSEEPYQAPPREPRYRPEPGMISPDAAASTGAAFQRLADSILTRATGDRSIEDMTRELLRGMLKQWLDEHLPSMVERLVREEIERVARRGR